jgi:hypothetical protein
VSVQHKVDIEEAQTRGTRATVTFVLYDKELFRRGVMALVGQTVALTVTKFRNTRSRRANNAYWGVVIPAFCEVTGYHKDEMHEILAMKFLRIENCPITGVPRRRRTPSTNTAEFYRYMEECMAFGATEFEIEWPEIGNDPGPGAG